MFGTSPRRNASNVRFSTVDQLKSCGSGFGTNISVSRANRGPRSGKFRDGSFSLDLEAETRSKQIVSLHMKVGRLPGVVKVVGECPSEEPIKPDHRGSSTILLWSFKELFESDPDDQSKLR